MIRRRPALLMAVFNDVGNDSRVRRAASALSREFEITILYSGAPGRAGLPGVACVRVAGGYGPWNLLLTWLAFVFAAVLRGPSVVYAHDFYMAFPGWIAARVCGAHFVYDAHDSVVPLPGRDWPPNERFYSRFEGWGLRRAGLIVVASPTQWGHMDRHYRSGRSPVVIRNIAEVPDARAEADLGVPLPAGGVRLVYGGFIDLQRRLDLLVDMMSFLGSSFRLLMAGEGPGLPALRERAVTRGVSDRVDFVGRLRVEDLYELFRRCHVGLLCYAPDAVQFAMLSANKIYEYPQAGLPVAGIAPPSLAVVVNGEGFGSVLSDPRATPRDLAANVEEVARRREPFRTACEQFSRRNRWVDEGRKLAAAVSRLAGGSRRP